MSTAIAQTSHIRVDAQGRAWIEGTAVKVVEIVLDHVADGLSPEEIHLQHYGSPTLAQIHAALAYYYDHQAELDAEIERQVKEVNAMRRAAGDSPVVKRLRAEGRLATVPAC